MKIFLVLVLLFLPFDSRAAPPVRLSCALEEFFLRENIGDHETVERIRERVEAKRKDWRLLKGGSYDWFWRPRFLQKKIGGYVFEFGSWGDTPVVVMRF